jgi:PAS domain-containing protein
MVYNINIYHFFYTSVLKYKRGANMGRKEKLREVQSKKSLNERFLYLASILRHFQPRKSAFRISIVYMVIGLIWILASDKILAWLPIDRKLITSISMMKGLGYVLVTGILLYFLVLKSIEKIRFISQLLLENYEELTSVYEELTASEQELARQIELLKESEEKYRLVSEATNDAIWDEKKGKRYFTERWYEITGYTSDEIEAAGDWMTLIHPEDIGMVREKLEWHKKNRNPYYRCEYRIRQQ